MSATGDDHIALIVLAAGGSSRMGRPKQLLCYHGKSLLMHAVENGLASGCSPVIVVVGHQATRMREELQQQPATVVIVDNPDWQQGMGSSIRAGMTTLIHSSPAPTAVMITLCDQPLVDATVMRRLINEFRVRGSPIAAASYAGAVGVPAIFSGDYFPALCDLPVEGGAKHLLQLHQSKLARVEMEQARHDIDTPADIQALQGPPNFPEPWPTEK